MFSICFDEDSDDKSEGYESGNSRFSETSLKEQQDEPELPKRKLSKRLRSLRLKRGTVTVGVQSLEDTERICPSKGSIGQTRSSLGVGSRSFP